MQSYDIQVGPERDDMERLTILQPLASFRVGVSGESRHNSETSGRVLKTNSFRRFGIPQHSLSIVALPTHSTRKEKGSGFMNKFSALFSKTATLSVDSIKSFGLLGFDPLFYGFTVTVFL